MTNSWIMQLFTVTIIPFIVTPVLAYAVPNPNPTPYTFLPSGAVDYTGVPTYAGDLSAVEEALHLYSVALDSNNLTILDGLFNPAAWLKVDPTVAGSLDLAAAKDAIVKSTKVYCFNTVHHHRLDTVFFYGAPTATDPGQIAGNGSFNLTESCGGKTTTYTSYFGVTFSNPNTASPGDRHWRFDYLMHFNGRW